jgi:hypothetical protein
MNQNHNDGNSVNWNINDLTSGNYNNTVDYPYPYDYTGYPTYTHYTCPHCGRLVNSNLWTYGTDSQNWTWICPYSDCPSNQKVEKPELRCFKHDLPLIAKRRITKVIRDYNGDTPVTETETTEVLYLLCEKCNDSSKSS